MDRDQLIQRLVLNEISDDYENLDQIIFPHLAEGGVRLGLTITRSEAIDTLKVLVARGFAKAYELSGPEPREIDGVPPLDVEGDFRTWFYITKEGMVFHEGDDTWWPFGNQDD